MNKPTAYRLPPTAFAAECFGTASLSMCGIYRYSLLRRWKHEPHPHRYCMFIGLNPSTADAETNDPTVRRCIDYARRWGYDGLVMANVFPLRSTHPKGLGPWLAASPVDPLHRNLQAIAADVRHCPLIVAAWGADPSVGDYGDSLLRMLGRQVHCLGKNNDGSPKHPLNLRKDVERVLYYEPPGGGGVVGSGWSVGGSDSEGAA